MIRPQLKTSGWVEATKGTLLLLANLDFPQSIEELQFQVIIVSPEQLMKEKHNKTMADLDTLKGPEATAISDPELSDDDESDSCLDALQAMLKVETLKKKQDDQEKGSVS